MLPFSWKKKSCILNASGPQLFNSTEDTDDNNRSTLPSTSAVDSNNTLPKRLQESPNESKSVKLERIKSEAIFCAENKRHHEAVRFFNDCILLDGNDSVLHEMKAQVLLEMGDVFNSVLAAEKSVALNKTWWIAYQTLGRAQMNFGDIEFALLNFQRALHLAPDQLEIRNDDIERAVELRRVQSERLKLSETPIQQQ